MDAVVDEDSGCMPVPESSIAVNVSDASQPWPWLPCVNVSVSSNARDEIGEEPCARAKSLVAKSGSATDIGASLSLQTFDDTESSAQNHQITTTVRESSEELDPSELTFTERLGAGAQSEVYKAVWWKQFHSSTTAITVAVKKLKNASAQKAYNAEVLTFSFRHPNLVRCFTATAKPPLLIVSELCRGGSLYELVHGSSTRLSWCQRLKILVDVAQGMEYLHNRVPAILHRDLKTCNVLLTKEITSENQTPMAKVADFGLSREVSNSDLTMCVGTWRWMAPEVFMGNEYDENVDVFSFGILMFEVLARQIPYAEKWPVDGPANPRMALDISRGTRPDVSLVQDGCPRKVVDLMQACWAADPQQRPNLESVRSCLQEELKLITLCNQVAIPCYT
jgi:serine/threonine protein kinase